MGASRILLVIVVFVTVASYFATKKYVAHMESDYAYLSSQIEQARHRIRKKKEQARVLQRFTRYAKWLRGKKVKLVLKTVFEQVNEFSQPSWCSEYLTDKGDFRLTKATAGSEFTRYAGVKVLGFALSFPKASVVTGGEFLDALVTSNDAVTTNISCRGDRCSATGILLCRSGGAPVNF